MDDPATIAASLTEAQRKAILSAEWREQNGAWRPAGWHVHADRRVRYKLCLAGLLRDYLSPLQRLTSVGTAVRDYLQDARHD